MVAQILTLNYDETAIFDDGMCIYEATEYFVDLAETGESSLVIIESVMDLEPGDEIGLFDMNGVVETALAGEEPVYGEVLVGSGVWMGDQLNLVAIGSVDTSEFGVDTMVMYLVMI